MIQLSNFGATHSELSEQMKQLAETLRIGYQIM